MNTSKRAVILALLVLTLPAACNQAGSGTSTGGINFIDGYAAGKAQAKTQSKPMFVFFTGDY